ncbi:hypothetical protein VTO73DRAFT_13865 [Trametes versicolor]
MRGPSLRAASYALFLWFEQDRSETVSLRAYSTLRPHSISIRPSTTSTTTPSAPASNLLGPAYHPKLDQPLPDPHYLHVHPTACRVAHPSGTARSLDLVGLAAVDGLRYGPSVAGCRGLGFGCSSAVLYGA